MHFVWPRERYDSLTREAAVIATALTTVAVVATAFPLVALYRVAQGADAPSPERREEVVTFVQPAPRAQADVRQVIAPSVAREPVRSPPAARDERILGSDTGSVAAPKGDVTTASASGATSAAAAEPAPTRKAVGPVGVPAGIRMAPVIGAPPPAWKWLPPTQAELDVAGRERDRLVAEAHDQHRPVAAPTGGGGSIPAPFLSMGPTRAQRARDSVIHADNVLRLARLAERARAKRDSLLRANTLAGPAKAVVDPRRDSARLLRPEQ
jgi:hypothetical protein